MTYQPARSPQSTTVRDIVETMRESGQDPSMLRKDEEYLPLYRGLDLGDAACYAKTVAELATQYDNGASGETVPG